MEDNLRTNFIGAFALRLESLLPNRSGYSLDEVELNPQFISTTNLFLTYSKPSPVNGHQNFISDIVKNFFIIIERLNVDPATKKLRERDEKTLTSTLIMTKLLSVLLRFNWDQTKNPEEHNMSQGMCSEYESSGDSNDLDLYSYPPPVPLTVDVAYIIEVLLSIMSPDVNRKALATIRRMEPEPLNILEYFVTVSPEYSQEQIRLHVKTIDHFIIAILRYIAAANPESYFSVLKRNVFIWSEKNDYIPISAMQKYACLLRYLYCTPEIAISNLRRTYTAIPFIRSTAWKELFLFYSSVNLQTQCIYRPKFYSQNIYAESPAEKNSKLLFDFVATAFDEQSAVTPSLSSWLVLPCVSDFDEFLSKPNKLKQSFNKRIKFLSGIIRDSQTSSDLNSFECLIDIFFLGCRIPYVSGGVREFTVRYLDSTHQNLKKARSKLTTISAQKRYRSLLVKSLVSAIAVDSKKYVPSFVEILKACIDKLDNSWKDPEYCRDLHGYISVIRELSDSSGFDSGFGDVMVKLHEDLRALTLRLCQQLNEFNNSRLDDIPISGSNNSSSPNTPRYLTPTHSSQGPEIQIQPKIGSRKPTTEKLPEDSISPTKERKAIDQDLVSFGILEKILADLLHVFTAAPQYFFVCGTYENQVPNENNSAKLFEFAQEVAYPIGLACKFKSVVGTSVLFDAACSLSMTLIRRNFSDLRSNESRIYSTSLICIFVTQETINASVYLSLTDPKFKSCFVFLNRFLQERYFLFSVSDAGACFTHSWFHSKCAPLVQNIETVLLLALCTHDIQFFSLTKTLIKWHIAEFNNGLHAPGCFKDNLVSVFEALVDDDLVFTGLVSLHKKIRTILTSVQPNMSLYNAWLLIYQRWLGMVEREGHAESSDDSLVFKHFTGFLVCTSGSFFDEGFGKKHPAEKTFIVSKVSAFFDKAINLSDSSDLVTRVVIKDALSNEPHPDVFYMIGEKLTKVAFSYIEAGEASEQAILFMEQLLSIIAAMLSVINNGSCTLVLILPEFAELVLKFIELVPNSIRRIKLKLRFCKFMYAAGVSRSEFGFAGNGKLRNLMARIFFDWLEQAIFSKTDGIDTGEDALELVSSPLSANVGVASNSKTSELDYLNVELASECSKVLERQLRHLALEVPDGTKEKNVKRIKDLMFSNYFSLFYKILQKHTTGNSSPLMMRSKFKIQNITDNSLKCISNLLEANTDIGMHFVLSLGYHENKTIRSFFLNIFAEMLASRKSPNKEENSDEFLRALALSDIIGAAAFVASPAEHNLLATSLHGVFSYLSKLDTLFKQLLEEEVSTITRSSDIFRRNSTLTRLMSIFAKEDGLPYLTVVLKPFIERIVDNNVAFEVEKSCVDGHTESFMEYFTLLVDTIVDSMNWVPESFKFICSEIYSCIKEKFEDTAIIAVGSFIFLRFFCPAIVSPESTFDMPSIDSKVKRSLMQLVRVIQYIANGTLNTLKIPGLQNKTEELNVLNDKVVEFLKKLAVAKTHEKYPFHKMTRKPSTSLRYLHKFLYTYHMSIHQRYILSGLNSSGELTKRIGIWRQIDTALLKLGAPKSYISLQGTNSYKVVDLATNISNSMYADFMAKLSAKNIEMAFECPVVQSAVFNDGTPVVVVNFRHLRDIGYDIPTFVYLIFEAASKVWDNRFYIVNDFTQFFYMSIFGESYVSYIRNYAPPMFFKNCAKIFYFNLPRKKHLIFINEVTKIRSARYDQDFKLYFYSHADDSLVVNSLYLGDATLLVNQDVRAVFKNCKIYDEDLQEFAPVTLKLGRKWIQICFEKITLEGQHIATKYTKPVETLLVSDLTKCDISDKTGDPNEFILSLNRYNYEIALSSPHRQEILRFLYFSMLRNSKQASEIISLEDSEENEVQLFGKLLNIVFHGLLENDSEVRSAASHLFATICSFYDYDLGIKSTHAHRVEYPVDTTAFVVSISKFFSEKLGRLTPTLLKAFFNTFGTLSPEAKVSGIMYISPWIDNVGEFLKLEDGAELVADLVRQFCRITDGNPNIVPFLNERIWRKLLSETRLTLIIVDEILAYTIENKSESSDWDSLISVITPSVEICGEVVSRLNKCIRETHATDSDIVLQSKLLEIMVLVKVCTVMFFNSYVFGTLYLLDVFFFCTLFISNPMLEFGSDLQKLVINTIQSFSGNPNLTAEQSKLIDTSIEYFSSQRAKMLFGLNSRERATISDMIQFYNKAAAFELFCDTLLDFISKMGSADDRIRWMTRWSSLSMEIAFSKSFFQKRALVGVATLARSGVSDATSSRVLKLLGTIMFDDLETFSNCSIACGQIEEGLTVDSPYFSLIVWTQIAFSLLEFPFTYQAIANSLAHALEKATDTDSSLERFVLQRCHIEPLLTSFEKKMGVKFVRQNLQLHFFYIICKGLTVSQFRHTSVTCLKRVLNTKLTNSKEKKEDFTYAYLFILYLSTPSNAFEDISKDIGFINQEYVPIGKDHMPNSALEYICRGGHEARVALLVASHIFSAGCDTTFSQKFIGFYCHLYTVSRESALLVFHLVQSRMHDNIVNSANVALVNKLVSIEMAILLDQTYSVTANERIIKETLDHYQFDILNRIGKFEGTSFSKEDKAYHLSKTIEKIFYRGICSVVDGQRLEKF